MKKQPFFDPDPSDIVIDSTAMTLAPAIELHFDYSVFDAATAQAMQTHARRIKAKGRKIGSELIDIGGELAAAKEKIQHGHWLGWLQDELQLNDSAAQRSIAVWLEFKDQRDLASLFNPRVLQLMSGRATPASAKRALIDQAKATGQSPTARQAEELINAHNTSKAATLQLLDEAKSQPTGVNQSVKAAEPYENSQGSAQPPAERTTQMHSQQFHDTPAPAPAWALQNHILAWLTDYQKTDRRPFTPIINDVHLRKPPTWTSLDAYLTHRLVTYTRPAMTTALSDALTTLRAQDNPTQTPPLRFINAQETADLIWSVIKEAVDPNQHSDAIALLAALSARPNAASYTQPLQAGLTLSNQVFQNVWQHIRSTLQRQTPDQQPQAVISNEPVTVTLRLEPADLKLLKQHLKNGALGRLPLNLVAELAQQLESQN